MADDDPARREQVLDNPQAERKTDKEPDSLLDEVRREPVAAINGCRTCDHRARRADVRRHFGNLTVPVGKGPAAWSLSLDKKCSNVPTSMEWHDADHNKQPRV